MAPPLAWWGWAGGKKPPPGKKKRGKDKKEFANQGVCGTEKTGRTTRTKEKEKDEGHRVTQSEKENVRGKKIVGEKE